MSVSKILIDGIGIDLTGDTVSPSTVLNGYKFHDANGDFQTGVLELGGSWNFLGDEPELLYTYSDEMTFVSIDHAGWTPTTTATSRVATQNITTVTGNMSLYEYVQEWRMLVDYVYTSKQAKAFTRSAYIVKSDLTRRANTIANWKAKNLTYNAALSDSVRGVSAYYSSATATTESYYANAGYGVYPSATNLAVSSTTSNTPTITFKTPAIYERCNTSYWTTDAASKIVPAESKIYLVGRLYRIKKKGESGQIYEELADIFADGL